MKGKNMQSMTSEIADGLRTALDTPFGNLFHEEGVSTLVRPSQPQTELEDNQVQWRSPFGRMTFTVQGYTLGNPQVMGRLNSYAQINLGEHTPALLSVHVKFEVKSGVRVYDCRKKAVRPGDQHEPRSVIDITNQDRILPFFVHINWTKKPANWPVGKPFMSVPSINRVVRDIDFVFIEQDGDDKGMFVQLQPSIFSCYGKFYFGMQTVFAGQVASTTPRASKRAMELGLSTETVGDKTAIVVPVFSENAWKGCDFLNIDGMVREIVPIAIKQGMYTPLNRTHPAKWVATEATLRPRDLERLVPADGQGLVVGTVLWFNMDLRLGVAMCPDGVTCFVHFKSICDGDYQPTWQKKLTILEPGRAVALLYGPGREAGQRQAIKTIPLN